jgi:hypothetical protein
MDLLSNVKFAWKGFLVTNTLTYYANTKITTVKRFIVEASGCQQPAGSWFTKVGVWVKQRI